MCSSRNIFVILVANSHVENATQCVSIITSQYSKISGASQDEYSAKPKNKIKKMNLSMSRSMGYLKNKPLTALLRGRPIFPTDFKILTELGSFRPHPSSNPNEMADEIRWLLVKSFVLKMGFMYINWCSNYNIRPFVALCQLTH